jgi:tRNA (cmo5U34)-methyltransferase
MRSWRDDDVVLKYLELADVMPHRAEGDAALLDEIPSGVSRVLDLGSGDGRLMELVLLAFPQAKGIVVDFSPAMLALLEERFAADERVEILEHDLDEPLPELGSFDAVISSFAIHHLGHERKQQLYGEIWALLGAGGVFCNLEHVASPTVWTHERFLEAMGITPAEEDPSNKLMGLETQLGWMRDIGFADVDCYWKWRELALIAGRRPARA